jgi:hypothetical protein
MMRDIQLDWKHWSSVERIVAASVAVVATFILGTVLLLHL